MAKGAVVVPCVPSGGIDVNLVTNYGIITTTGRYILAQSPTSNIYNVYVAKVGSEYCIAYNNVPRSTDIVTLWYAVVSSSSLSYVNINNIYNYGGSEYKYSYGISSSNGTIPVGLEDYESFTDFREFAQYIAELNNLTIQYISGSIAVAGPKIVSEGSTVTAYLSIPTGVTVTDSDISITKNGTAVQFTYSNGVLTFTA